MLNKEVCMNCHDQFGDRFREIAEGNWKKFYVICFHNPLPTSIDGLPHIEYTGTSIYDQPPNWCPYILEHLVANRQDEIDKKELTNA